MMCIFWSLGSFILMTTMPYHTYPLVTPLAVTLPLLLLLQYCQAYVFLPSTATWHHTSDLILCGSFFDNLFGQHNGSKENDSRLDEEEDD
jgi:hypothetical protein